jgi:hypothetical protein
MRSIDLNDPRLTERERHYLRTIAVRLGGADRFRAQLPEVYRRELDRVFGSCGEGERDRWQPWEK